MVETARVDQHHARADVLEIVPDFEIVEDVAVGQHVLQERAKLGDVPLPVAQLIDPAAERLLRGHREVRVEGRVHRLHPKLGSQHQERLVNGLYDALRVDPGLAERLLGILAPVVRCVGAGLGHRVGSRTGWTEDGRSTRN